MKNPISRIRWLRPLALMGSGAILGVLFYGAYVDPHDPVASSPAKTETHETHEEGEEGIIRIPAEALKTAGVETARVEVRPLRTSLQVTGVVAPDQTRVAHIRPIARGVVEKVFVQLGDRVQEGDPLLSYDNIELGLAIGDYLTAHADLQSSLTNLNVKETILKRSEEMLKVGAVARTTHDIRVAEYRDAQAQVNSARARVAKVEEQLHRFGLTESDIDSLSQEEEKGGSGTPYHRTESHSILRAPFSGVITWYDVAEGETVDPSDPLLSLTDISTVWVLADVYEENLAAVRVGKEVSVRVASYPEEVFRGRITYISDLIEPKTRTARVRCVVPNPRARLKLDMFATIEIPTEQTEELLAVPSAAIQRINDRPVVFVQRSETEFEQREVVTGLEADGWTEIRQGLQQGEPVVTEGSFYLKTAALRELINAEE